MSRSYKKKGYAYQKGCPCCHEIKSNWFKPSKRKLRNYKGDLSNGKYYKKILSCRSWDKGSSVYVPENVYNGYYHTWWERDADEFEWYKRYKMK